MAGEAQPSALGIANPEFLDRRRLLLGLSSHPATLAAYLSTQENAGTTTQVSACFINGDP
jgi:hypothetical protein